MSHIHRGSVKRSRRKEHFNISHEKLMTDNAKRYNGSKSTIYKDVCKLETFKELSNLYKKDKMSQSTKARKKTHLLPTDTPTNSKKF